MVSIIRAFGPPKALEVDNISFHKMESNEILAWLHLGINFGIVDVGACCSFPSPTKEFWVYELCGPPKASSNEFYKSAP